MESAAEHIWREGRRSFPMMALSVADISGAVRDLRLEDLSPERASEIYLALSCAQGEPRALAVIEEHYFTDARRAIQSRASNAALADDALQQLRTTIFLPRRDRPPQIGDFRGTGSLAGWLRIAGLRLLLRMQTKEHRWQSPAEGRQLDDLITLENPELSLLRAKYGRAVKDALTSSWHGLAKEDRLLLKLRYRDGHSIDDVAAVERIHRATAARRLQRAEAALVREARRRLRLSSGASNRDLESVLRLIRSHIELSVSSLMGADVV